MRSLSASVVILAGALLLATGAFADIGKQPILMWIPIIGGGLLLIGFTVWLPSVFRTGEQDRQD